MKSKRAVTIRDVAKAAGVSIATVSSVFNGRNRVRISLETRERILKVAKELGYRPRRIAQGLRKGLTYLIGLAIPLQPDLSLSPFFYEAVTGALKATKEKGWMISILGFKDRTEELSLLQKAVSQRLVDGVLLFDPKENDSRFPLLKGKLPFVVLGRTDDPEICTVDNDNIEAAKLATQHLIRLGHKRIAFVHIPPSYFTVKDRLEGYRQALTEAKLPFRKEFLVEADGYYGVEAGYRAMLSLLEKVKEPPTAVLAMDDTLALGCIQAATEKGLKVPNDLAVVGFNDSAFSAHSEPPLTTVRIFAETLAYYAVDMLLRLVQGEIVEPKRITMLTQLIVRKSCGAMS